jgi:hypothetical protein
VALDESLNADYLYLFYPELLSETALADLIGVLNKLETLSYQGKVHVFSFFASVWAL